MRVHVSPRVIGRKDTISVLEIEFTSKARRVKVRGTDRVEPLDLSGAGTGGSYDVSDLLPRVHVPLRVLRDGPGRAHLHVVVEDAAGALAPESWEGDVVLDAPPVQAEHRRTALLLGVFSAVVGAIVWFVGIPLLRARNPKVPSLAGLSRAAAEKSLKDRGIAPVVQFVDPPSGEAAGTVLAQSPGPDVVVDKNSTVMISVARAIVEAGALVPSLVGRTEAEATTALAGTGFRLDTVDQESAPESVGRVIRQAPAAQLRVPEGSRISIVVGRAPQAPAPRTSSVPLVTGRTRRDAETAVQAAGLVPVVEVVESNAAVEGAVFDQSPAVDTQLPVGSTVMLRVAKASAVALPPMPPTVPPVPPVAVDVLKPPTVPSVPPVVVDVPKPPTVPSVPPVSVNVPKPPTVPSVPPVSVNVPKPPTVPSVPSVPPVSVNVPKPPTVPSVPPVSVNVPKPPTVPSVPPVSVNVPKPPTVPTDPPRKATPDVLGLTQAAAEAAIRAIGLEPRAATEEVDEGDPEGLVLRQEPLAGDPSSNGLVAIYVGRRTAAAPPAVPPMVPPTPPPTEPPPTDVPPVPPVPPAAESFAMPDVLGLRIAEATSALEKAGLVLRPPTGEPVEAAQVGLVLGQDPAAGASVAKGSMVQLHLGDPETDVVPSLPTVPPTLPPTPPVFVPAPPPAPPALPPVAIGPVTPRVPAPPPTPGVTRPPTIVAPPAVTRPATRPIVAAALGAETRRVPDFTGRDGGDAIVAAIAEGFVPVVVADRDARAAAGRVRVQSIAPGTPLQTGSRVTLSVGGGYGSTMVAVPDVSGMSTADASAVLARAGIRAEIVAVRARPGVFTADGRTVVAQSPAGWVTQQLARWVRIFVVVP